MTKAGVDIYLDTRRKKANECFPVKFRVYHNYETRYYSTGIDISENDFNRSYLSHKPRGEKFKNMKAKILSQLSKAIETAENLKEFDFYKFEKNLFRKPTSTNDVFSKFEEKINFLQKEERIKTKILYQCTLDSFKKYLRSCGRKDNLLLFQTVSVSFLERYEQWMLKNQCTLTSVGIYVRSLRAIFNEAIKEGEIERDVYPFGRGKYEIPGGENVKRALDKKELKQLFEHAVDEGSDIYRARDFWFLQYNANGMNIRDICDLKYLHVLKDRIVFRRSKTRNTTKSKPKIIQVILTPYIDSIIKKYGNKKLTDDTYVFPILNNNMTAEEKVRVCDAFNRYINQHIKKLASTVGLTEKISNLTARHSFSTISVQNGASLEFIQEALGHASIKTTMNYWKGFADEKKKFIAEQLMNF